MRILATVLAATTLTASLHAQAGVIAVNTAVEPTASDSYAYQPDGRRDPFLSVLRTGSDPNATSKRGSGISGFALAEISVRGVLQSRAAMMAMVQGPDNKTYVIHQGDKLADGVVKSVTTQGLVVIQDVSDPLSTQKQREVRKLLRSLEGGKQ